ALCARHEELLRGMRDNQEVNRIENLRVLRLEFVHVRCPGETYRAEVTALITFQAKVYFVREWTGAFLRGSRDVIPYQEFRTFRRHGAGWRLQTIERSHESDLPAAPASAPESVAGASFGLPARREPRPSAVVEDARYQPLMATTAIPPRSLARLALPA